MGASDYLKDDQNSGGSSTYIELHSDEEAQREAYRLVSRGGRLRQNLSSVDDFFGQLIPHIAKHLFEDDSTDLMKWMELDEEDLETYREEVLEAEEDD